MEIIIITGTPGCGKSSITKKISKHINSEFISINDVVRSKNFIEEYDEKRDTYVIDFGKLLPYLINLIKKAKQAKNKYLFIEGHFADIIPKRFIDLVIILRCHPDILKKRLEKRKYKYSKVRENLQAEILGNCANYILEKNLECPIFELDTSDKSIDECVNIIEKFLNTREVKNYQIGKIDWLCELSRKNRLEEFFE